MTGKICGRLYTDAGAAGQSVATAAKCNQWQHKYPSLDQWGVTGDYTTNNRLTIGAPALYFVNFSMQVKSSVAADVTAILYVNGAAVVDMTAKATTTAVNDYVQLTASTVLELAAGDYLEVYIAASTTSTVTLENGSLNVFNIGVTENR